MLKEDKEWVLEVIRQEISKIRPVEIDVAEIVNTVLDKIKPAEKVPVIKGKKEQ